MNLTTFRITENRINTSVYSVCVWADTILPVGSSSGCCGGLRCLPSLEPDQTQLLLLPKGTYWPWCFSKPSHRAQSAGKTTLTLLSMGLWPVGVEHQLSTLMLLPIWSVGAAWPERCGRRRWWVGCAAQGSHSGRPCGSAGRSLECHSSHAPWSKCKALLQWKQRERRMEDYRGGIYISEVSATFFGDLQEI